jgi:cellobiose-specific phosphotransferase system component IIC
MANLQRLLRIGLALAFNPARIIEDAADAARRTAILLVCTLIAGLILLPAVGCAAAGLWIFVQNRLGPVWAAFITAAALAILALISLLIGLLISWRRAIEQRERRASGESAGSAAAAALQTAALAALAAPKQAAAAGAAAGRGFFARHKGTALLAAAVAGLLLGQDLFRPSRDHRSRRR